ncbi:hypothetical protein CLF_102780, partial [Clonorchis sinensis]
ATLVGTSFHKVKPCQEGHMGIVKLKAARPHTTSNHNTSWSADTVLCDRSVKEVRPVIIIDSMTSVLNTDASLPYRPRLDLTVMWRFVYLGDPLSYTGGARVTLTESVIPVSEISSLRTITESHFVIGLQEIKHELALYHILAFYKNKITSTEYPMQFPLRKLGHRRLFALYSPDLTNKIILFSELRHNTFSYGAQLQLGTTLLENRMNCAVEMRVPFLWMIVSQLYMNSPWTIRRQEVTSVVLHLGWVIAATKAFSSDSTLRIQEAVVLRPADVLANLCRYLAPCSTPYRVTNEHFLTGKAPNNHIWQQPLTKTPAIFVHHPQPDNVFCDQSEYYFLKIWFIAVLNRVVVPVRLTHPIDPIIGCFERIVLDNPDRNNLAKFNTTCDAPRVSSHVSQVTTVVSEETGPRPIELYWGVSRIDTQERGFRPSFPGRFCSCRSAAVVHLKGTSEKRV